MRNTMITGVLLFLCFMIGACNHGGDKGCAEEAKLEDVYLGLADPVPDFDVYMTWRHYDPEIPKTDPSNIPVYVLNGEVMGSGEEGFGKLIDAITKLPSGSTMLFFPSYFLVGPEFNESESFPTSPFINYRNRDRFWDVLAAKRMVLIRSPRDNVGRIHPYYERRYPGSRGEPSTNPG